MAAVIGILIDDFQSTGISSIAFKIENAMKNYGHIVFLACINNNCDMGLATLKKMEEADVDVFIVAVVKPINKHLMYLSKKGKVVIVLDDAMFNLKAGYFIIDYKASFYKATEHLIESRFEKIALITMASQNEKFVDCYRGYRQRIGESCQKRPIVLKISEQFSDTDFTGEIFKFLITNKSLDAIICATTRLTYAALLAFKKVELVISKNIGLVGCGDDLYFANYNPSITCLKIPTDDMANCIISYILEKVGVNPKIQENEKITFDFLLSLKERESSWPLVL